MIRVTPYNSAGNVRVVIGDQPKSDGGAKVLVASSYWPYGSLMNGRSYKSENYRYGGAGGQEMDNEIAGVGNSYTAEFWQYDSRLGRRWNIDPKKSAPISGYATFSNNPIYYIDPLGDTVKVSTSNLEDPIAKARFRHEAKEAIKELRSTPEGEKLYKELHESENVFVVEKGSDGSFKSDSYGVDDSPKDVETVQENKKTGKN